MGTRGRRGTGRGGRRGGLAAAFASFTPFAFLCVVCVVCVVCVACSEPPRGGEKGIPFDQLTIENIVKWPDGREYVTVVGRGYPEEGQKESDARRRTARDGAAMAAQEKMIAELKKLAPREKIRDLLRQADVAKTEYSYDDICTMTLRLPKELLGEKKQVWNDER